MYSEHCAVPVVQKLTACIKMNSFCCTSEVIANFLAQLCYGWQLTGKLCAVTCQRQHQRSVSGDSCVSGDTVPVSPKATDRSPNYCVATMLTLLLSATYLHAFLHYRASSPVRSLPNCLTNIIISVYFSMVLNFYIRADLVASLSRFLRTFRFGSLKSWSGDKYSTACYS